MILRMLSRSSDLPLNAVFSPNFFVHKFPARVHHDVGDLWVKKLFHDGFEVMIEVGKLSLVEALWGSAMAFALAPLSGLL